MAYRQSIAAALIILLIGACCRLPISSDVQEVTVIVQGDVPRDQIRYAYDNVAMKEVNYQSYLLVGYSSFVDEKDGWRWMTWTGYFKTDKKRTKPEVIEVTVTKEDGAYVYKLN